MSRQPSRAGLACAIMLVWPLAVVTAADGPEELLREKGLYVRGSLAVLAGEQELSKGLSKRRPAGKVHESLERIEEIREVERGAEAALERAKRAMEQGIANRRHLKRDLEAANPQETSVEERNRVVANYNDAGDRIAQAQLEGQRILADLEKIREDLAAAKGEYVQAILTLRKTADETTKRYEELAGDEDVKRALDAMNSEAGRRRYRLGPSSTFQRNVKRLEKLEKTVQSETIELKQRGGVYWVEVIYADKQPVPSIIDTGAGFVTLPSEVAEKIGLRPTRDDRTIQLKVADGRTVRGRLVRLSSVRVGPFTEKDVSCVVLPDTVQGAVPLLGQSFLRRFAFEFDASAGKLSLTKVALPEDDRSRRAGHRRAPARRR